MIKKRKLILLVCLPALALFVCAYFQFRIPEWSGSVPKISYVINVQIGKLVRSYKSVSLTQGSLEKIHKEIISDLSVDSSEKFDADDIFEIKILRQELKTSKPRLDFWVFGDSRAEAGMDLEQLYSVYAYRTENGNIIMVKGIRGGQFKEFREMKGLIDEVFAGLCEMNPCANR